MSTHPGPQPNARKRMLPNASDMKALQIVYDLACEMSHCSSYAEIDDDGTYVGVDPAVLRALNRVKICFGLKGDP